MFDNNFEKVFHYFNFKKCLDFVYSILMLLLAKKLRNFVRAWQLWLAGQVRVNLTDMITQSGPTRTRSDY
jgi:hypothetical protein